MRVLLIQVHGLLRRHITEWLAEEGHEIVEDDPEVVLLDLHPWVEPVDGLEPQGGGLLPILRQRWPDVRVVVISGADEPELREWAASHGITEWVAKPFTREGAGGGGGGRSSRVAP